MAKSPLVWYGGKFYMAKTLLGLFPPHKIYCEVFGGAAHVLMAKAPANDVYNDIDSGLVNFFRVLRDRGPEFCDMVQLYPYSREEFCFCRDNWEDEEDPVRRAAMWFVSVRQSFAANRKDFGFCVTKTSAGLSKVVNKFICTIPKLPEVTDRLRKATIENIDFRRLIPIYDTADTLFYCDPPYMFCARAEKDRERLKYKYEMTDKDHADLLEILQQVKGKVVLSGYNSELYNDTLAGWRKVEKTVLCNCERVNGKRSTRTEVVWLSPNCDSGIRQLTLF